MGFQHYSSACFLEAQNLKDNGSNEKRSPMQAPSASAATSVPGSADRHTDRHLQDTQASLQTFIGSSSSADLGFLCPKPSPFQCRGCQEGPKLHRGRSPWSRVHSCAGWP